MIGKRLFGRDSLSAVFRVEFYSLFNHTNVTTVDNRLTSPGFGTITAAADPRIVQPRLKFTFSGCQTVAEHESWRAGG
jgi:hypothetical protein